MVFVLGIIIALGMGILGLGTIMYLTARMLRIENLTFIRCMGALFLSVVVMAGLYAALLFLPVANILIGSVVSILIMKRVLRTSMKKALLLHLMCFWVLQIVAIIFALLPGSVLETLGGALIAVWYVAIAIALYRERQYLGYEVWAIGGWSLMKKPGMLSCAIVPALYVFPMIAPFAMSASRGNRRIFSLMQSYVLFLVIVGYLFSFRILVGSIEGGISPIH